MEPEITVGEVIDRLADFDRGAVLRLAVNPFFPLEHTVAGVVGTVDTRGRTVVYIAERGEQLGPVPQAVAVGLTWHEPAEAPPRRRRTATGGEGAAR